MPLELTADQIEKALKTVTDRLDLLDALVKGVKVLWYRCRHSGLLFPSDYASEWGKKYGIGLGPDVVSETLNTRYDMPIIHPTNAQFKEQIMHPLEVTKAQLDPMFIAAAEAAAPAIVDKEDPAMVNRVKIIMVNQMKNPASKLPLILNSVKVS